VTSNPGDGDAEQILALAAQIVNNLGSPDILALQEIQDNSGVTNDGTLDADETLQALVDAIADAGGPVYSFESAVVDVDGETGGVPGGNIRNAFLYNAERVEAVEITTLEVDELTAFGVTDPTTFDGTRDPLLGTFTFNGEDITLINNHFSSRFGSEPIFGGPQPFNQGGEDAREAEAKAINEVVDALLAEDGDANVVVLGDLNTFQFTDELTEDLPGVGDEKVLTNLIDQVPGDEAYTFNFQGNSQALDHVFVTDSLLDGAAIDIVHVNTDFADFTSDHEPIVVTFNIEQDEDQILIGTFRKDNISGAGGDDEIFGLSGRDKLFGLGGDDLIKGGFGRDYIDGGDGDDELFCGFGRDDLSGGAGDDELFGGRSRDHLNGGEGDDDLYGGRGRDKFVFEGDFGDDIIHDFHRRDDLLFRELDANQVSIERNGEDLVLTAIGEDTFGTVRLVDFTRDVEDSLLFV
jgi:Ca2+-binding RTX toxin-like protein